MSAATEDAVQILGVVRKPQEEGKTTKHKHIKYLSKHSTVQENKRREGHVPFITGDSFSAS